MRYYEEILYSEGGEALEDTGCPKKFWMTHWWKFTRPGWMQP